MPDYTYLEELLGNRNTTIPEILSDGNTPNYGANPRYGEQQSSYGTGDPYKNKRLPNLIGATGNIEEYLAQNQSRGARVVNGTLRLGLTTATKFFEGAGYLADLGFEGIKDATSGDVDKYGENFISRAADNGFSAFFSNFEEGIKEALPIYKTQKYKDASPFEQLWSLSFWTDDFVDGLAFMLSTWIPGGALSKMGMGAKIAGGLSKYAKLANLSGKVQNLQKAGRGIDKLSTWALMTSSEAMFEAKDVKDAVIDQLYELKEQGVLNPTTGQPWTDETIKKVAAEKARNTYIQNLMALAPSNFIETGFIFGKIGGKVGAKVVEKAGTYSRKAAKGAMGYLDSYGGRIAEGVGLGIITEGLWEENIQYSIQRMNEIHGDSVEYGKKWYYAFSDFPKAMETLGDLEDDERLKNVILGGLLGMGGGARRGYIDKRDENKAIDDGIKNVQGKYKAAFGMDVFAKSPAEKITYGTEVKDGETKYFKESFKEGEKARTTLSEFEYEKQTRDNGIDPTKGGTIEIASKPIATEDGNLVQSEQKMEEFVAGKRFVAELEDVIEAERNKPNPNKRKLDFFINEKLLEWARAEFDLGRGEEAYKKLDDIGNMTPEELGILGFDYRSEPNPKQAVQRRKELVKEFEKIYNITDNNFQPPNVKKSTLINNQGRKEEGYRIGSRMAFLKRELADLDADFNLIGEKDTVAAEINRLVYEYEYVIANITKARADNLDATEYIEEAEKLEAEIKELKSKAGLKENTDVIRGKRTADSLDAEVKLIQRADIINSLNRLSDRFHKISDPVSGYNYFINSIKEKPYDERSLRSKIDVKKETSVGEYEEYEKKRTKREFLFDKIDNASLDYTSTLLRKMFGENIPLLNILEKVRADGLKLNRGSMTKIKAHVKNLLTKRDRYDSLAGSQMIDEEPLTAQEQKEMEALKKEVIDDSDVQKTLDLYDEIISDKKRYTGAIKNRTIGQIHEGLVNEYIEDGEYLNGLVENNKLFDNVDEIDKSLNTLGRIKEIFEERKGVDLTPATIKKINNLIKRLNADKLVVIKRRSDNEEQEKRLVRDITITAFASLGIDIETFINKGRLDLAIKNEELYNLIKEAIPSLDSIIKTGSYIEYAVIVQKIKDAKESAEDKADFQERLENIYAKSFDEIMKTEVGKIISKMSAFAGKSNGLTVYRKNPSRALNQIMIEIPSSFGLSFTDESNPAYRYDKNKLLSGLVNDIKASNLKEKDSLAEFFERHKELISLHDLINTFNSEYNLPEEVAAEKFYGKLQQSHINKKATFIPAPTAQQLFALRMFGVFFNKSDVSSWNAWASMTGPAGSGKTIVFAKWIKGVLKLAEKEIYTVANAVRQAEIIRKSLTPNLTETNTIGSLLDSLKGDPTSLKGKKLIVIDEAARLSVKELEAINNALDKYNKKQKPEDYIRILALSDRNQFTDSSFPAINDFTELLNSEDITDLPNLSILYRSTVPALNDALNMFSNQENDLRKEPLRFKSNAATPDVKLYGAEGTRNFVQRVKELTAGKLKTDERRRAIIVSEQIKNAWEKNNPLASEIADGVAFLTVPEVAGDNFDEVYVYIPDGDYSKSPFIENRAIYTAMSRARYFVLLGEFNVSNIHDSSIEPLIEDEEGRNIKKLNEFVEERRKDEDVMHQHLEGMEQEEEDTEEEELEEKDKDDENEETGDSYDSVLADEPEDVETEEEIVSQEDEEVEYYDEKPKRRKHNASEHRSHHTSNTAFKEIKVGTQVIPPIQEGDEVWYVVGTYQDRKDPEKKERRKVSVMQRVEVEGEELFREVSVISKHDPVPKGYERLFERISSIVDTEVDPSNQFEARFSYRKGLYRFTNKSGENILGTGVVKHAERRSFEYDTKGTPREKGFRRQLISALVKSMYPKSVFGPIWGKDYTSMVNNKITSLANSAYFNIFTNKDRKTLLEEGYGIIPGLPYLVVPNAYSLERGKTSRTVYLRLDWQKLKNKDKFLAPLAELVKKIKQIEKIIATKKFRMGNAVFNDFISMIANNREEKEITVTDGNAKKFGLDASMIGETIRLVDAVDAYLESIKGKKFNISDELRFLAKEVDSMLYDINRKGERDNNGSVQKLFDSVARATNYVNGVLLQTSQYNKGTKRNWVTGKRLLSGTAEHSKSGVAYRRVSEQLKRKLEKAKASGDEARIKLAQEEYDNRENLTKNISLADLETILESELNASVAISKFNANVKRPKESKNGRGVRNTFVAMHPSFVDVDIEGEYADKQNKQPKTKEEETTEENQKKADRRIRRKGRKPKLFSKIILSESELGGKVSRQTARAYLRKVIPGITNDQIRFVDAEEIMRLNDDKQSYGLYLDGVIYLLENKDGTVYEKVARHEAFHKIFNEGLTLGQKTVFAVHFAKENPQHPIKDGENALEYLARVEEEIADLFMEWRGGKIKVGSAVERVFNAIMDFIRFVTGRRSQLDKYFKAIDEGRITGKGDIALNSLQSLSRIRRDYSIGDYVPQDLYRTLRKEVIHQINIKVNGLYDPANEKDPDDVPIRTADGAVVNVPQTFQEAMDNFLDGMIDTKKELEVMSKLSEEDDEWLAMATVITKQNAKKQYDVYKRLINDIFPTIHYSAFKYFREFISNDIEDVPEERELETIDGIIKSKESELYDSMGKTSQRVRQFASTIEFTDKEGYTDYVDFRYAYRSFLEAFSLIDINKSQEEYIKDLEEAIPGDSSKAVALKEKIASLIKRAKRTHIIGSNEGLPIWAKFSNQNMFVFSKSGQDIQSKTLSTYDQKDTVVVKRTTNENTLHYFQRITRALEIESNLEGLTFVKSMYEKAVANETLLELQTHFGSLYKQNIWKGQEDSKFGKVYGYHEEEDAGGSTTIASNISHFMTKVLNKEGSAYFNSIVSRAPKVIEKGSFLKQYELAKSLLDKISILNTDVELSDPKLILQKFMEVMEIFNESNEKSNEDKVLSVKSKIRKMADVMAKDFPKGESFNYFRGDRKRAYLFIQSNMAMDTLRAIIHRKSPTSKHRFGRELPGFLNTRFFEFNIMNPLPSNTRLGSKRLNKIHDYDNYDSSYDKKNKRRMPTRYEDELDSDFIKRTFWMQFIGYISKHGNKKDERVKYKQPFWVIGERGRTVAAEVNLLPDQDITTAVRMAIIQEAHRPDSFTDPEYNVVNYDVNRTKSYLPGMKNGAAVIRMKGETDAAYNNRVDQAVQRVMAALQEQANEFYNTLSTLENVKPHKELEAIYEKMSGYFKMPKGVSNESIYKDQANEKRADYLEQHKKFIKPLADLWFKNFFINSHFLNQLVASDQAYYQDEYDMIKRLQIAFADGWKGAIGSNWMNETFKVAVGQDVTDVLRGEQFNRFKKIVGKAFNYTDGAGFMLPERFENIKQGFPESMGLGVVMKPVYWGIDKFGILRAMKYATVVLTDDIVTMFPDLKSLRDDMRHNNVGEYVFNSAMKVGAPVKTKQTRPQPANDFVKIRKADIVELRNEYWRIQLNPIKEANSTTKNPTAISYFANARKKNKAESDKIFNYLSELIDHGMLRTRREMRLFAKDEVVDKDTRNAIRRRLIKFLEDITGQERTGELLSAKSGKDNYYVSMNMPSISEKLISMFISNFSKNAIEVRLKGSDLVLQTAYGAKNLLHPGRSDFKIKREPRYRDKEGYAEVYMPDIYKGEMQAGDLIMWDKVLGFRIPSTDLHSAIPLKIIGFYPSKDNANIIIAPKEIVWFSGADYDVDTLFIIRKSVAQKDYFDDNGDLLVKAGKFMEGEELIPRLKALYLQLSNIKNKTETEKELVRDLDYLYTEVLKNELFNNYMKVVMDEANEDEMTMPINMDRMEIKEPWLDKEDEEKLTEGIKAMLSRIASENNKESVFKEKRWLGNVLDQIKFHADNHRARKQKGVLVNKVKALAYLIQSTPEGELPMLQEKYHFVVDDVNFNSLSIYERDKDEKNRIVINVANGEVVYHDPTTIENFDILINAAIDNLKLQYLPMINLKDSLSNGYSALIAMGVPFPTAVRMMMQPAMIIAGKKAFAATRDATNAIEKLLESKPKQADIRVTKTQKEKINIYWGANENAHLSNFAERPYSDPLGVTFRNVESAFQYTKTNYADGDNDAIRLKLQSTTGAEAKKLGRQIKGLDLEVWDKNSSVIMKEIIKESFEQNPEALQKLLDTGDTELTHTQDKGKWKTEFPRLLMEVRKELSTGTYKGQQGTISDKAGESTTQEESPSTTTVQPTEELPVETIAESITSQELEATMFKPLEELTQEQLQLQLKILDIFTKMDAIGKAMTKVAHAVSTVQGIEGKYTALQEVLDDFDSIFKVKDNEYIPITDKTGKKIGWELKDSFPFTNTQLLGLPHINSSFKALKFLKTKVGNIWFLHHKNLVKFSEGVYSWVQNSVRFGKDEANVPEDIRRAFIRFMLSSFSFEGGPSISTIDEAPYQVKNGALKYDVVGAEAWSQRFMDEISDLKRDNLNNLFLANIEIVQGWKGIKYLRFGAGFQSKIEDIHDYEDGFRALPKELQKRFLKYSIIHNGLEFGVNSYTYVMQPELFEEISEHIDNTIYSLFARKNLEESKELLDNLKVFFSMQYFSNVIDYVDTLYKFADRLVPFKKGESKKDQVLVGHEIVNNKKVFFNRRYALKFKEKKDKEGNVTVTSDYKSFPLITREFDTILYKLAEVPDSKHVYYVNIGQNIEHRNYHFDLSIAANGYNPDMVYSPYVKTLNRSGEVSDLTVYERPEGANYRLVPGDTVLIKNPEDVTGVTGYIYRVTKENLARNIISPIGKKYTGITYNIEKVGPIEYSDKKPLGTEAFELIKSKIYQPESFLRTRKVRVHTPKTKGKQQRIPIKDGVNFIFTVLTPELAKIGTQEQYSAYLNTIFPDSKVKDIVYHGSKSSEIRTVFNKDTIKKTGVALGKGFFFAGDRSYAQRDVYGYKSIGAYLLNLKNPIFGFPTTYIEDNRIKDVPKEYLQEYSDEKELRNLEDFERTELMRKLGYDGVVYKQGEWTNENIVFEPEQIHILGSKQDVARFKEYMKTAPKEQPTTKDNKVDISRMALQEVLVRLRNKYGIRFRRFNDPDNPIRGEWRDRTIWINLAHVKKDTPFHEYLHPIIEAIRVTDKAAYARLVAEVKKHPGLIDIVRKRSPELNDDQVYEEAIVEMLGENVAERFNIGKNVIQNIWNMIKSWLQKLFPQVKLANMSSFTSMADFADMLATDQRISMKFHGIDFAKAEYKQLLNLEFQQHLWDENGGQWNANSKTVQNIFDNLIQSFGKHMVYAPVKIRHNFYIIKVVKPTIYTMPEPKPGEWEAWWSSLSKDEQLSEMMRMAQEAKEQRVSPGYRDTDAILDDIVKDSDSMGFELKEDEESNYYVDKFGKIYNRLTEWAGGNFSYGYDNRSRIERKVKRLFSNENVSLNDKITLRQDGVESQFSFDDLVNYHMINAETARVSGKLAHAILQQMIEKDPVKKAELQRRIERYAEGKPGIQEEIPLSKFKFITDHLDEILSVGGIRVKDGYEAGDTGIEVLDKIVSEMVLYNEDLEIATTADLVVQHDNNDISLIDWKSGAKFYGNISRQILMKYGNTQTSDVYDTKVNRAKLELVLRAMIIKAKFPNVRFRNISLAHLSESELVNIDHASLTIYLGMVESYLSDSKNNKTDVYKKFKEQGLFNPNNYGSQSESVLETKEDLEGKTYEEKIEYLGNRLFQLDYKLRNLNNVLTSDEKLRLGKEKDRIYETLRSVYTNFGEDITYELHDISKLKKWLSVPQYEIANPLINILSKYIINRKDEARNYKMKVEKEFTVLLKKLKSEYDSGLSTTRVGELVKGVKYKDLFGFMWTWKNDIDKQGYYGSTTRTYIKKDGTAHQMTDTQWEFNQYVRRVIHEEYNATMDAPAYYDKQGNPVSKARAMSSVPKKLNTDFLPRTPLSALEVSERYGPLSKEAFAYQKRSFSNTYFDSYAYYNNQTNSQLPVRYLGNDELIASNEYSFDIEKAFLSFVGDLVDKRYLDPALAFAQATKMQLAAEKDQNGIPIMKNSMSLIDDMIVINVFNQKKKVKLTKKPIRIGTRVNDKGENVDITLNTDKLAGRMRHWVSFATIGFKVVAPTFNTMLIMMLNTMKASVGSIAKRLGVPREDIDFTLSDLTFGAKEWLKMSGSYTTNDHRTNKLRLLAKHFDYMNDNYDFKIRSKEKIASKAKLLDRSNIFLTYRIGEDFALYTLLAAQLRHMKIDMNDPKSMSMWDAYQIEDGQVVYKGGMRGYVQRGDGSFDELHELTTEETIRLKRVSQLIHGGYRDEEKTAMDITVYGEWLQQFKRYMKAQLNNAYAGKFKDKSLGAWKPRQDEFGNIIMHEGATVYEFLDVLNQGRVWVMWNVLKTYSMVAINKITPLNIKYNEAYTWRALSSRQKQHVVEVLLTGAVMASWLLSGGAADDDEAESALEVRLRRLMMEDITQGLRPADILRNINQPVVVIGRLYDVNEALFQYMFNGVIKGERLKDGRMPGAYQIRKSVPIMSTLAEFERYFKDDIKDSEIGRFLGYKEIGTTRR